MQKITETQKIYKKIRLENAKNLASLDSVERINFFVKQYQKSITHAKKLGLKTVAVKDNNNCLIKG